MYVALKFNEKYTSWSGENGLILFNHKPERKKYLEDFAGYKYPIEMQNRWGGVEEHWNWHDSIWFKKKYRNVFNLTFEDGAKECRLVIDKETSDPMFYIQRVGENLFIAQNPTDIYSYIHRKKVKVGSYVEHNHRISNKLFPEITDKDGIIGVNVELI